MEALGPFGFHSVQEKYFRKQVQSTRIPQQELLNNSFSNVLYRIDRMVSTSNLIYGNSKFTNGKSKGKCKVSSAI
jgi:hypothetical protein